MHLLASPYLSVCPHVAIVEPLTVFFNLILGSFTEIFYTLLFWLISANNGQVTRRTMCVSVRMLIVTHKIFIGA
jgi:hypothetical protein